MDKMEIKKVLHQALAPLADNKGLLWFEFQIKFNSLSGENFDEHFEKILEVIEELQDQKIIRAEQLPRGLPILWKGLHFDKLKSSVSQGATTNPIHISSLHAHNVQLGNQNNMNIGITPEQFVYALSSLTSKKPDEAKSIIEKISSLVKSGATVAEAIAKLATLVTL